MAIFCTQCGTKNEDGAAFCESCGTRLLKAVPARETLAHDASAEAPKVETPQSTTAAPDAAEQVAAKLKALAGSKKVWYSVGGVAALLVVGGAVAYFVLSPPAATPGKLLAAAKEGYGKAVGVQYKRELCLSNMNYGLTTFNVGQNDQGTQSWLNALVSAGLYSPAVPIDSGGYFPQTLLQYVATPELAKWRDGARLCLAKDVEIADVVEIDKPQKETMGRSAKGAPATLLTVKAQLVLQSTDTAPWLEKPEIQTEALGMVSGWEYKNAKLQKQIPDTFGLRDGQWATGPAYKMALEKQYQSNRRGNNDDDDENVSSTSKKGFFAGLGSKLSHIFSFGGHPLKGTWKMDTQAMGNMFGRSLPSGLGLDATMTFTSDSLEVGGQSVKCKFEVDGKRVKVIPEGQAASLIFIMEDKDTASIDMGLFKMKYTRAD